MLATVEGVMMQSLGSRRLKQRWWALSCAVMVLVGCGPPSARLSFPAQPVGVSQKLHRYDVDRNGVPDFGVTFGGSGQAESLLYDDDEDGRFDRAYRLADYTNDRVPHLILLLDSIPYQTVAARYAAGDFRWFGPPVKLIAPFPTLTEVCYSRALRAPPLPGAIDQHYDPRIPGWPDNFWDRVHGWEQPWERRVHYHADYLTHGLTFLDPDAWFAAELEQARLALEQSSDRVTIAYFASAASMVCKYGQAGAQRVLDGTQQLCLQVLYERRGAIKITLMSDHGHNYRPSTNISLDTMLENAGFNPCDRLEDPQDVVVEIDGLVTYAGVHTKQPAKVAEALCQHEPIELAMYMDGDRAVIRDAHGTAAIECRDGQLRYIPADRDVLSYSPLIDKLTSEGVMDEQGFATDEVWFHRTLDHGWPNAPRRVWDALHGNVVNPATVLLSIKDGYCAGIASYENFIQMASTHGGLNQVNSATFVMTMTGRLKEPVPHEDVLDTVEPGFVPRVQR